jgi:demethylmenaquinone methyltransferase/2-methoxy-6-polyprenyl-1,4-benzoquinol methylase
MAGKYYAQGEERAAKVVDLFAAVAPKYDLINDLQSLGLHRWWKHRLVELAEVRAGDVVMDVCCGTGDVAFALAARGAQVTGLDFSAPMLQVARNRDHMAHAPSESVGANANVAAASCRCTPTPNPNPPRRVQFVEGDALQLPCADATVDVITVAFGLRNVADVDRALAEWMRVLRPGGRLLVLEFGRPANPAWNALYEGYLRWFVPLFGSVFLGDADTHGYILESLLRYPGQRGVDERLRRLGFAATEVIEFVGGAMSINRARK